MLSDCLFLESGPRWPGDTPYRCAVGVNFCSVRAERELCRTCPIGNWGQVVQCEHLDIYTFQQADGTGRPFVQVQMQCSRPRGTLPDEERCAICPEMQEVGPDGIAGRVVLHK